MKQQSFDQFSVSRAGAKLFGVTPQKFCDWRWQMRHQLQSVEEIKKYIPLSLLEKKGVEKTSEIFRTGISPYYASLMYAFSETKLKNTGRSSAC